MNSDIRMKKPRPYRMEAFANCVSDIPSSGRLDSPKTCCMNDSNMNLSG